MALIASVVTRAEAEDRGGKRRRENTGISLCGGPRPKGFGRAWPGGRNMKLTTFAMFKHGGIVRSLGLRHFELSNATATLLLLL